MKKAELNSLLRKAGFRVTRGRLALIQALSKSRLPESLENLSKTVTGILDAANVYRALESFVDASFVRKINFRDGKSYYELVTDRKHHHHIVCLNCRTIEDVSACGDSLERATLRKSKKFSMIDSHSLEFFGLCRSCGIVSQK